MKRTIYTTAPEDYDGFSTRRIGKVGIHLSGKKPIYQVEIDDFDVKWQVMRYQSGMHMAVEEEEWQKMIAYELVEAS